MLSYLFLIHIIPCAVGVEACQMQSLNSFLYSMPVIQPPSNVSTVQESPTSIRVSWSPSSNATGYTISYSGGSKEIFVEISDGSTSNYLLTGLQSGTSYNISIVATSSSLPSDIVVVMTR